MADIDGVYRKLVVLHSTMVAYNLKFLSDKNNDLSDVLNLLMAD